MSRERKRAAKKMMHGKKQPFEEIELSSVGDKLDGMTQAFKNNYYVVMVYDKTLMAGDVVAKKIMIQAHNDKPIKNHWRELQSIKSEIFGRETVAIEYYPPESTLIDDFNIYWLWIIPNQPLAFKKRSS